MSQLFSEGNLGGLSLDNRIVIAPMCQYSAHDGFITDWHHIHYGNLALSGAGVLIIEATAVQAEGRISPNDLGIWSDQHVDGLSQLISRIKRYSSMPLGIQLAHAGRKASTAVPWEGGQYLSPQEGGWVTVAPSDIPFANEEVLALTLHEIDAIKQAFVESALRAEKAGFELIEIHSAHGYLLHEFLSPLSNQRTDQYGGSLANRMRLLLEIFEAIKTAVNPKLALGVRISGTDWIDQGWDIEQSKTLAQALDALGCDFIHVSSGGLSTQQSIPLSPNYQVPLAHQIHQVVKMPTIAVGLITEAEQAEAIIATGQADFVGLARGILYNPRWPWHAAEKLGARVNAAPQYLRSAPRQAKNLFRNPQE